MADLVSEIMEIDSDDDSSQSPAPKKTKNEEKMEDEEIEKKNNEIEKKTDEIILIDSEEDDEKEKEEDDVKIVPAKTVKREPPTVQPEIIDLNDDDEEPIKKVFTPKVDESLEKREGLIIKNVEEITKVKIEEGMDVEETVIKKEKGTEEKKNDGEEGKCKGEGAKKEEEEDDEIRVEKVVDLETQDSFRGTESHLQRTRSKHRYSLSKQRRHSGMVGNYHSSSANRSKCLNSGCKSGVGLEICKESCIFTFYGMRPRGKQLVCRECLRLAEEHFEKLVSMLKENKPLFSANFPRGSDVVLLDDSDDSDVDEFEGEEVELDEEVSRIVGNSDLLESLIKETMDKCGYDKQMEENEKLLKEDAQSVEDTLKDLNERFEKVFNRMVDMHNQIYDAFKPATKSVSPIEIVHNLDFESPPPAVVPSHHQHASSMKLGGLSSAVMPRAPPLANQSAGGGGQGGSTRMVAMKKVTQYSPNKPKPSTSSAVASEQDIVALDSAPTSLPQLPPIGVVERPKLSKGDSVYVMRQTLFTAWGLAEVLEIMPKSADNGPDNTQLRIAYDLHKRVPPTKLTSAKLVAYSQPSAVRLPVGSRVIAVYRGDDDVITSDPSPSANHYFYSGIVAEAPKINNKFRYLVFFDDGYTQYVLHENIRLVCESSKNVWEDVHPESKQFIKDYLTRYPERPMVKLSIDEIVKTEWNGKWWVARVQAIDASLVKMYFDADERTEWIYRGSTRLGPLYIEMIAARDRQSGRTHRHAGILKRQNPYVEYTQNIDEGSSDDDVELVKEETLQPARSVARKSTNPKNQNQKPETVYHRVGPMDISVKPKQFIRQQHPGVISEEPPKVDKKPQIDIGKEAAMEAEVRAARERAIVPLESRIKSFREMLAEKDVSAFSTWEKELHKIVFDPRYLLLTSKERKQVFEKYVKERAEEERREKRNKMKERKDEFRKLMEEANLHGKSSFGDFAQKFGKDDRFKNIEKMRERESLFNEYLLDVRKREKDEKAMRRDQVKRDFLSLLREQSDIDRHSRWQEVKKKIDSDVRYKSVDSSTTREDWFREYLKALKEERKREKEKDRERKDRKERGGSHSAGHDKEGGKGDGGEASEEGEAELDQEKEKELEKAARVEASLREREKEVQRTLAVHLRDRDNEREQHKHDEAVQHFNALLADLVRNSELAWREAKRQLRKDHRWELAELLDRDEKEKLFNEHIEQLSKKKKEKFRELLNETAEVTLSSSWKEVRKLIKDDPRYSKFSSSDRKCEREFKEYIKDKMVTAKAEIRELLQETKLITHKSLSMVQENESHMKEFEDILKKDRRYLVLDHVPEERTKLVMAYLEDLEKRGPPPPPTASEPSRRGND